MAHDGAQELNCGHLEVMNPLEDSNVMMQVHFMDATKRTQKVAQPCPDALHRVVVHFTNLISIFIARPLAPSGRVANLLECPPSLRHMVIGLPLVAIDGAVLSRLRLDERLQCLTITMPTYLQTNLATLSPHDAGHRGTIIVPRAVASPLVGTTPWWIIRIIMFVALFARILIQFIGFDHSVCQLGLWQLLRNQPLDQMADRAQVRFVNLQLLGQMAGRDALRNPTDDQHDLPTRIPGATPDGVGEEIEDCTARAAAIVHDWRTMPVMRLLLVWQAVSVPTVQPIWMEHVQQIIMAALLVQEFVYGKDHHVASIDMLSQPVNHFTLKAR